MRKVGSVQAVRAGTSAVDSLKYRLYLPTYQPQFPRTHLPLPRPDYGPVFARLLSVRHRFLPLRIRPPDGELENSPFLELTNQDAPPGTQAIVGGGKLDAIMPAFRVPGSYDGAAVRHKGPSSKPRGPSTQSAPALPARGCRDSPSTPRWTVVGSASTDPRAPIQEEEDEWRASRAQSEQMIIVSDLQAGAAGWRVRTSSALRAFWP